MISLFPFLWAHEAFKLLLGFIRGEGAELLAATCLGRKCVRGVLNVEEAESSSLLELPELAIEGILYRLPPASLCQMAVVCKQLQEKCRSDHLWEPHVKLKWGTIAGPAAYTEWQNRVSRHPCRNTMQHPLRKALVWPLSCVCPLFSSASFTPVRIDELLSADSLMAWYWALETGAFWFPAQVYNRENGHAGFILSCYDAELSYCRKTDTFNARYPPHGSRAVVFEENIQWERLRAAPVDTPAHKLHVSDCLHELRPGDHVEVQWRKNKNFPYGWWYGVVGHLDICDVDNQHCRCHLNDFVWIEFKQYSAGSRWRHAVINRKTHREEGNDAEGFYAGIRKLRSKGEISVWKQFWPNETLD